MPRKFQIVPHFGATMIRYSNEYFVSVDVLARKLATNSLFRAVVRHIRKRRPIKAGDIVSQVAMVVLTRANTVQVDFDDVQNVLNGLHRTEQVSKYITDDLMPKYAERFVRRFVKWNHHYFVSRGVRLV